MQIPFVGRQTADRYGLIVEIGSGSVGAMFVASSENESTPQIVWSTREEMPFRNKIGFTDALQDITDTVRSVFSDCSTAGMRALQDFDGRARVGDVHISITAPWAYTVSKRVHVEHETPFTVTEARISKLIDEAKKKAFAQFKEHRETAIDELTLITDDTIEMRANGYRISSAEDVTAERLDLARVCGFTYPELQSLLTDQVERIFPNAHCSIAPFLYRYYTAFRTLHFNSSEVGLVDVTNEATELGVVRDGILSHVTYTPYGIRSVAREIADVCDIPLTDALAYVRNEHDIRDSKHTEEIKKIFDLYETNLTELLQRTGDTLLIPRTMFIHSDVHVSSFITERIANAARNVTGTTHSIHPITPQYFDVTDMTDTALLVSAVVFHNQ